MATTSLGDGSSVEIDSARTVKGERWFVFSMCRRLEISCWEAVCKGITGYRIMGTGVKTERIHLHTIQMDKYIFLITTLTQKKKHYL